jgi:uncharacterized protein (TIGR03085 family)
VILSRETRCLHRAERAELLDTYRRAGPDAPTLCEGWPVRTLAAHIVVSEQYAGLPLLVSYPVWRVVSARTGEALRNRITGPMLRNMTRAEKRGWDWLLGRLEAGPPKPFAVRMVAEVRLLEEWIHHEDVRRATGAEPRPENPQLIERLVEAMLTISRFAQFAAPRHGIEVHVPDGRSYLLGEGPARSRVAGPTGEVLLWLAGRGAVAHVEVTGELADDDALRV